MDRAAAELRDRGSPDAVALVADTADDAQVRRTFYPHPRLPQAKLPETQTHGWLPLGGAVRVGLTAGASTPNNIIGMVVERLTAFTAEPSFSDVVR